MSARPIYSVFHPSRPRSALDIPEWLPIATQRPNARMRWQLERDAPVSVHEARRLEANGTLLMAQRKIGPEHYILLIKTPAPPGSLQFETSKRHKVRYD